MRIANAEDTALRIKRHGNYSGLNLNQDKATKPQTVQIVRQGEATPYWFKVNLLYLSMAFGTINDAIANWSVPLSPKVV